ncbi:hypothetical protein [Flavobacterium sp. JP2137]|uniref:hypothetical protein n=1 Tax=Flavobacterium sp. JP2137 TaxID=3414510 RepID=UPI003D2FBC7F
MAKIKFNVAKSFKQARLCIKQVGFFTIALGLLYVINQNPSLIKPILATLVIIFKK